MGKAQYTGVSGAARKVVNSFVGVNGVARKVTAGFVGVAGVARQFLGRGIVRLTAGYYEDDWSYSYLPYDVGDTLSSGSTGVSGAFTFWDARPVDVERDDDGFCFDLTLPDVTISFSYDGDPLDQRIEVELPQFVLNNIKEENSVLNLSNLSGKLIFTMGENGVVFSIYVSGRAQAYETWFNNNIIGDGSYVSANFTLYTD